MTNLTYGILPSFFWTLILPIMWLVSEVSSLLIGVAYERSHVAGMHFYIYIYFRSGSSPTHSRSRHTTEQRRWYVVDLPCKHLRNERSVNAVSRSALSQHWLFGQNPESLDPRAKYHSLTSGLGTNYTQARQVSQGAPVCSA